MTKKKEDDNMVASDFNLQKLRTDELHDHIVATAQANENIAIFGRRGSGKTEISKQAIKSIGAIEVYINVSLFERVDFGGYPNILAPQQDKKFVDFLLPQFYQSMLEGNTPVIALLDEVDKADQSIWAPLLEFTQFRSINGRKLHNLKCVIMTGNLIAEGGQRPSLPLLDRAEKYLIESDWISFEKYAAKSGKFHPAILAYLQDYPKDLHGKVDPEERYADQSPRGWERASNITKAGEKYGWKTEMINQKVAGCIGKECGIKYEHYYAHYIQLLPKVAEIFSGVDVSQSFKSLEPTKQLVLTMIVATRLAAKMDITKQKNLTKQQELEEMKEDIKNVGRFFKSCVHHDASVLAIRNQITLERIANFEIIGNENWSFISSVIKNSKFKA